MRGTDMIISFAGHSSVSRGEKLCELVKEQIIKNANADDSITFYLGGYGDFDEICARACRELKRAYKSIELVYVMPYITASEQEKVKEMIEYGLYDSSIYPPIETVPPKFAITKRNEWMVSNADLIIAFVKHKYGGAYKTLTWAKRKNKKIINLCNFEV